MNKLCNDPALEPINMSNHTDRGRTFVRHNVEVYIIWCRKFGIPELSLMDVSDLVDKKSVKMVLGTILAVGREARARALPCPVVAVLEQTYKMNYESMIDAVVGEDAIDDSKDIHDSVKLKRKRFQMIKAKALSGANIRQGTLDDDKRNIQEDILCLMYLKGFKRGDESAESVIKGWQGAVRNGDYRSSTLPSNLKAKLDQFEGVDLRYGQTLPRNYGGAKSPSNLDGSEEDEARRGAEIEELRNFKTPDLSKFEDQEKEIETKRGDKAERRISFGFGLSDIFGSKEKEEKSVVNAEKKDELVKANGDEVEEPQTAEYVLTIPGEQFNQMRESGILGDMLENYVITDDGEYNVVLTGEQYSQFQALINQDTRLETVSQAQAEEKTKKRDSKKKVKKSKSKDGETDAASPNATPKSKRKSKSKLGRWGSKSSIKHAETSESEADPAEKKVRRTKSFSFNKKKRDGSASEDGERKRRSSLFGRKKKKNSVRLTILA
ncbi:uncharacterized protein LOC134826058 [Bolinopsis microptera]|uniref:uncharacterized protein LOC134826058 n=1 Tax=Bolinopsis microptera TaxID=2820187 RepID=UPI00307A6C6A